MFADEKILISTVFIAGFASFFLPCTFPVIPVYLGILTDADGEYKKLRIGNFSLNIGAVLKTVTFVLGLAVSFVTLGIGAGFLGRFLTSRWLYVIAGLIIILLGIHQMDLIHIKKLDELSGLKIQSQKTGMLGTFLMGVSFSIGWTPCAGPILGAVVAAATTQGTALYGAFLMLIYTLGLMIPFIIMVVASDFAMSKFDFLKKNIMTLKRIGGGFIVIMGILVMFHQVTAITVFFERLFK